MKRTLITGLAFACGIVMGWLSAVAYWSTPRGPKNGYELEAGYKGGKWVR